MPGEPISAGEVGYKSIFDRANEIFRERNPQGCGTLILTTELAKCVQLAIAERQGEPSGG